MNPQEHIGIRLKKWMEDKGLTAIAFAEEVGIQRSAVSHLFSGRNKPSIDVLLKMKNAYPDLELEWLITGERADKTAKDNKSSNGDKKNTESNEFTDVNTDTEKADYMINKDVHSSKNRKSENKVRLIRIIELYSDHSFKTYDSSDLN